MQVYREKPWKVKEILGVAKGQSVTSRRDIAIEIEKMSETGRLRDEFRDPILKSIPGALICMTGIGINNYFISTIGAFLSAAGFISTLLTQQEFYDRKNDFMRAEKYLTYKSFRETSPDLCDWYERSYF